MSCWLTVLAADQRRWLASVTPPRSWQPRVLIKSTPICVIDLFPSRNEPHVTRIVSRLKRSWPTSAVNHKFLLTGVIPSPRLFVPSQTIVSPSPPTLFCSLSRVEPPSLSLQREDRFVKTVLRITLKHSTKWRGLWPPRSGTLSEVKKRKWRSQKTQTYFVRRH